MTFEQQRLDLFRAAGFDGHSLWLDRTYAIRRGDGPCPTLVIHGGMAESSVWYRLAPLLDGPVVLLDRPGHGLSGEVDYTGVDFRQHAVDWLHGVITALGVAQVNLVGNSMGGYFATVYALAHPSRVRSLVLAGAPAGTERELPRFIRMWRKSVIGHAIGYAITHTHDPKKIRNSMRAMCTHPEWISDQALRVAALSNQRPGWNRTMRSMIRAASDRGGWRPALSIRESLTTLEVPMLFAWGDRDSFAPPSSGQAIAARMPNARFQVLDDAGHLPMLDQPEALATGIRRFLGDSWHAPYGVDAPCFEVRS